MRAPPLALGLLLLACGGRGDAPEGDAGRDGAPPDLASGDAAEDAPARDGATEDEGAGEPDLGPDLGADAGPPLVTYTEAREPCADRSPERRLYWGDLHVHTRLSFDAYLWSVRGDPSDAYRFARGEELRLPPLDTSGAGTVPVRLERALDFAAVTDHAELLGEVALCLDASSPSFDSGPCTTYRESVPLVAFTALSGPLGDRAPQRDPEVCGRDGSLCLERAGTVWASIVAAADAAYDRSATCAFTAFVGYEHTGTPDGANVHRNVIFRNDAVPELPLSYIDAPGAPELWRRLEASCVEGIERCDVLTIPHNANASNGEIFALEYPPAANRAEQRALAAQRARLEPLLELYQHKGSSECEPTLGDDHCNFERIDDPFLCAVFGCDNPATTFRFALARGLAEEQRLGIDPLRLGVIGSTDTHNATPGLVDESAWPGHVGLQEDTARERATTDFSPGGLAAVWAIENSRDALFEAMLRRETFATSGPRIAVRFFGGWDLPEELCAGGDFVARGDAAGVPMGGELGSPPAGAALRFAVLAEQDVVPLEQLQIIKVTNVDGALAETVVSIAGDAIGEADVDPASCEPRGPGARTLCAVWEDPEADPTTPAAYYARVLENPTCRFSERDCATLAFPPPECDEARRFQERAWTSPIWVRP